MNKLIYVLIFQIIAYSCSAQMEQELKSYEDSILKYFNKILNYKTDSGTVKYSNQTIRIVNKLVVTEDSAKLVYSEKISALFGEALSKDSSFSYPFSRLKNMSNLKSSDSLVRVITWNIPLRGGTHKYFGYVQKVSKENSQILLFKLTDESDKIKKPEFAKLKPNKWYGALYYHIITNNYDDKTYYTLLGWDGNNQFTNKKLIECFCVDNKRLKFGESIFRMNPNVQNRIIFEYSKPLRMMLRYDNDFNMIVYDHLAPENRKFTGQYMYYGPDMSQDGIIFKKGQWLLKENLNLKNKENVKVQELPKSF